MSEKEYKEKSQNCFLRNTILINQNEQLEKDNAQLKVKIQTLENQNKILLDRILTLQKNCGTLTDMVDGYEHQKNSGEPDYKKMYEEEKQINAYIKARFVKCNQCSDEKKEKCVLYKVTCNGEKCTELIDLEGLINIDNPIGS